MLILPRLGIFDVTRVSEGTSHMSMESELPAFLIAEVSLLLERWVFGVTESWKLMWVIEPRPKSLLIDDVWSLGLRQKDTCWLIKRVNIFVLVINFFYLQSRFCSWTALLCSWNEHRFSKSQMFSFYGCVRPLSHQVFCIRDQIRRGGTPRHCVAWEYGVNKGFKSLLWDWTGGFLLLNDCDIWQAFVCGIQVRVICTGSNLLLGQFFPRFNYIKTQWD